MTFRPEQPPLLEIQDLSISFGKSLVLNRFSCSIPPKGIHALVGESGSGKSIAALSIGGLQPPQAIVHGKVLISGHPIDFTSLPALRLLRQETLRYVFQDPFGTFNPSIIIGQQLAEALPLDTPKSIKKEKVLHQLEAVGIEQPQRVFNAWPFQMSGGMLQRASLAMALLGSPSLLICDEPTTALDPHLQQEIIALLKQQAQQNSVTILFITHDLRLLPNFAHHVTVLSRGSVVEQASTADVFLRPQSEYTKVLLDSLPDLDRSASPSPAVPA
ncbi:MAG: ATP-binding cassette domain-containing protein [Puniceicoccaceae bacterium]